MTLLPPLYDWLAAVAVAAHREDRQVQGQDNNQYNSSDRYNHNRFEQAEHRAYGGIDFALVIIAGSFEYLGQGAAFLAYLNHLDDHIREKSGRGQASAST